MNEDYNHCGFKKGRLATVISTIWILFVIFIAGALRFLFAGDTGGHEEVMLWQREVLEVGRRYVSMAGQRSDGEFEGIARRGYV